MAKRQKLDDSGYTPPQVKRKQEKEAPVEPLVPGPPSGLLSNEELESLIISWVTFDARRLYDTQGRLLPVDMLDESTARALAGVKVVEEFDSEEGKRTLAGYSKEVKWEQRIKAAELLMRLRGLDGKSSGSKKDRLDEIVSALRAGPVKKKIGDTGTNS